MFELGLLHELAAGRHDPLQIGEMPDRVRLHMGCKLPFVYLSKYTFDKIMRKHRHVTLYDLLTLPDLLKKGRYIADRANAVAIIYQHPETRKDFVAAVKVTKDNYELWLSTFHRAEQEKIERLCQRGPEI